MRASHLCFWQTELQRGFHSLSRVQIFVLVEDFLQFVDLSRCEFSSDSARGTVVYIIDGRAFRRGRFTLITRRITTVFWNWIKYNNASSVIEPYAWIACIKWVESTLVMEYTYSLEMSSFLAQPELRILVSPRLWLVLVLVADKPCHMMLEVWVEPHTAHEACASSSPAPEPLEESHHERFERASPQKTHSP